jgi:hypothetical protein
MDYRQLCFMLRSILVYVYVVLSHDISCIRELLFTLPVVCLTTLLSTGTKLVNDAGGGYTNGTFTTNTDIQKFMFWG